MKKFERVLFSLLISSLSVVGCVKGKDTEEKRSNATFEVSKKIDWKVYVEKYTAAGLPKVKRYQFDACVRDLHKHQSIVGHDFIVWDGDKSTRVTSNSDGCFSWSRSFNVNFGVDPIWVAIEFEVQASGANGGIHKGSAMVPLAINPWKTDKSSLPEVVDLNFQPDLINPTRILKKVDPRLAFVGGYQVLNKTRPQLWVEDVIFQIGDTNYGAHSEDGTLYDGGEFDVEIKATPSVRVKNEFGKYELVDLREGKIHVKMWILQEIYNGDRRVYRTDEEVFPPTSGYVQYNQNGHSDFKATTKARIPYLPPRGDVEIGLRIWSDSAELDPFEGVYTISYINSFTGFKRGTLKPEIRNAAFEGQPAFQLKNYVDFHEANELKDIPGFYKNKYLHSRADVRFASISKNNCESALHREVMYTVKHCIYHPLTGRPVPNAKLKVWIREDDGPDSDVESKKFSEANYRLVEEDGTKVQDGCIVWEHSLIHNVYKRQRYFIQDVMIENEELGIQEKMKIAINPWDYGFTFGRDYNQLEKIPVDPNSNTPRPKIVLNLYKSKYRGQTYRIDDNLNVDIIRTYRYLIEPWVTRYDSTTRGREDSSRRIRDGAYIARFVLVRHPLESVDGRKNIVKHWDQLTSEANGIDEQSFVRRRFSLTEPPMRAPVPEFITSKEENVIIEGGRLKVDIPYTLREIETFGARNSIIVQLVPANPDTVAIAKNSGCVIDESQARNFQPDLDPGIELTSWEAQHVLILTDSADTFVEVPYSADDLIHENAILRHQAHEEEKGDDEKGDDEKEDDEKSLPEGKAQIFAKREALNLLDISDNEVANNLLVDLHNVAETYDAAEKVIVRWDMHSSLLSESMVPKSSKAPKKQNAPRLTRDELHEIVNKGIFPSNTDLHTEGGAHFKAFAHLLCGFWYETFFDKYMTQEQIATMGEFLKHNALFQYTEPWLDVEGDSYTRPLSPGFPFAEPDPYWLGADESDRLLGELGQSRIVQSYFANQDGFQRSDNNPFLRCMKDPYAFFSFEKKTVVHELDGDQPENTMFGGAYTQNFSVTDGDRADNSESWDIGKAFSYSLGGTILSLDGFGKGMFSFGGLFRAGGDQTNSVAIKKGRHRGRSLNVSLGPNLVVTKYSIRMKLKKYRQCLVIRPTGFAMSGDIQWSEDLSDKVNQLPYRRSGLMLCDRLVDHSKEEGEEWITENFYYAFQHFTGGGDPSRDENLIYNRPFLAYLRGTSEFLKFVSLTKDIVRKDSSSGEGIVKWYESVNIDPLQGTVDAFKAQKVADRTGFYPGIYTHTPVLKGDGRIQEHDGEKGFVKKVMDAFGAYHILPWLDFVENL